MTTKLEFEVEAKSSADKIWAILTHECMTLMPKALPHIYQSFEALEGDGTSPGSSRIIKFVPEFPGMSSVTETVLSVDEENKTMSYTITDGEIMNYLNNFKSVFYVKSKDDGTSIVKFNAEFDKVSEEIDGADLYQGFAQTVLHDLDAYFLKA